MSKLREQLADLEHIRWAMWMKYLFSVGTFHEDGSWTMPPWAVERWQRQMNTPYKALTEKEQDSDRREADNTLEIVREFYDPRCDDD